MRRFQQAKSSQAARSARVAILTRLRAAILRDVAHHSLVRVSATVCWEVSACRWGDPSRVRTNFADHELAQRAEAASSKPVSFGGLQEGAVQTRTATVLEGATSVELVMQLTSKINTNGHDRKCNDVRCRMHALHRINRER